MNDQYLKMVLALPESFFEGWNYEDGDQFYLIKDNDGEYSPSEDYGLYTILDGLLATTGWHDINNWCRIQGFTLKEGRPIPSQAQLLQIYKTKKDLQSESMSLLWLANWIDDKVTEDHGFCFKYESAEVITLLWVQETCFNQKWDGKEWI